MKNKTITFSKEDWTNIGKTAGWIKTSQSDPVVQEPVNHGAGELDASKTFAETSDGTGSVYLLKYRDGIFAIVYHDGKYVKKIIDTQTSDVKRAKKMFEDKKSLLSEILQD